MDVSHGQDTTDNTDNRQDNVVSSTGEDNSRNVVKINECHAASNITNTIQGIFIILFPFAVHRGGYWAIIAMVWFAQISCYTGKILVECLYEPDPTTGEMVRVRDSYVEIAKVCLGPKCGARDVNRIQIIQLYLTCIIYVSVCTNILKLTYPGIYYEEYLDNKTWMMVTGIVLVPLAFLKSLRIVSLLSFWCTMSHLVMNVVILGYCFSDISDWGWSKIRWSVDIKTFPMCLSAIMFSYTSHIFLPVLEGNMIDKSKFNSMLNWSYIAAVFFNILFGYIFFLTFQDDTYILIINNLNPWIIREIVYIFFVIKILLSYPLPYYAVCGLLKRNFLCVRIVIIIGTVVMGTFTSDVLILISFFGSFTSAMLSFILPCYFHIKIKGHCLDRKTIAYDYFVIFLGVLFAIVGIYSSTKVSEKLPF